MKTYRLANAEKLLKEIRTFLDDNMGWITQRRIKDKDLDTLSHDTLLFNINCEMREIREKIQKYLKGM